MLRHVCCPEVPWSGGWSRQGLRVPNSLPLSSRNEAWHMVCRINGQRPTSRPLHLFTDGPSRDSCSGSESNQGWGLQGWVWSDSQPTLLFPVETIADTMLGHDFPRQDDSPSQNPKNSVLNSGGARSMAFDFPSLCQRWRCPVSDHLRNPFQQLRTPWVCLRRCWGLWIPLQ